MTHSRTAPSPVLEIELLGKQHQVACPEGQEAALRAAADLLNQRVDEIKSRSKGINQERGLTMAALNLCHELLRSQAELNAFKDQHTALIDKLNQALKRTLDTP